MKKILKQLLVSHVFLLYQNLPCSVNGTERSEILANNSPPSMLKLKFKY